MNIRLSRTNAIMSTCIVGIYLLMSTFTSGQNPQFVTPIEGSYGEDYIIVNYVDWGGIKDHMCGTKTYEGHQGTDIVLRSFPQMDSGVFVLAADTGIVTFIHDGEYDKNTVSDKSKGFGNYIAVRHPNKMYSYYAHLKKNSMLVQVGDHVSAGQRIAQVGSSGNSTDPHLHFETWYDSLSLVDPFAGPCGNPKSRWISALPYDTTFHVWDDGMMNFLPPLDSMRFRVMDRTRFTPSDSVIAFWSLMYGLRKGDELTIRWTTPSGTLWFEYTGTILKDWWYYYYASYIDFPAAPQWGLWKVALYRNDRLIDTKAFELGPSTGLYPVTGFKRSIRYEMVDHRLQIRIPGYLPERALFLCDLSGRAIPFRIVQSNSETHLITYPLPDNCFYLLRIRTDSGVQSFKITGR